MFRKYVQWSYFYKGVSVGTKGGIQSVTLNKENEVKIKDDMVKVGSSPKTAIYPWIQNMSSKCLGSVERTRRSPSCRDCLLFCIQTDGFIIYHMG